MVSQNNCLWRHTAGLKYKLREEICFETELLHRYLLIDKNDQYVEVISVREGIHEMKNTKKKEMQSR
ncbi:hypothetical protein VNO78_32378 [Psophocarpus tetragonolobus]|uniref:Uncharacterized protein n=1 Tax=Psophocarpus tetragonolobus TaxID=3891 RepID=A0AAN9P2N6_PSOTE